MSFIDGKASHAHLAKRIFDVSIALTALIVFFPILVVAALGIKIASPGPVFYKARRMGKDGKLFSMIKFRTMHLDSDQASAITAPGDSRVFTYGALLRRMKIDEIPQFWNILNGEMSLVGPRPEDPKIVERDYEAWMRETLSIKPGVTGPGSIYGYIYGEAMLDESDVERSYARNLLPPKLALERAYMERANFWRDLGYILLTAWAIVSHILQREINLPRAEIEAARRWAPQGYYPNVRT